ncbi:MAG: fumarylacetoacetate hydrolase family protein [Thermoflexales bacterium]
MKLVTYQTPHSLAQIGALLGETIIDLSAAHAAAGGHTPFPTTMQTLLEAGDAGMGLAREALAFAGQHPGKFDIPASGATLLAPLPRPGKIICLGRNYAAHAKEGGAEVLEYPILFIKPATSVIGPGATIVVPASTTKPDFEAELAVVIGRTCKDIDEAHALEYVAGYTCANDVSARDLQKRTHQWDQGKMLDTFCPLGPALVTADEIPEPGKLDIRSVLNGAVMQHSTTALMIFSVPFTISYISKIATLEPGDIILTGTPDGVGQARNPPVFLQNGDTITIEIERVGTLTNPVRR